MQVPPPMMFTEKSQASLIEESEEIKVEEEKNDYFDYQFHPVPQESAVQTIVGSNTIREKPLIEVEYKEMPKPLI